MKKILILFLVIAALPVAVYAQLPFTLTDLRCGDGTVDQFEMCEGDVEGPNYCSNVSNFLKIDTVCWEDHCTCLPNVNKVYCGNDRREGVEMCDGAGEDFCGALGDEMNLSLKCDPATCGCQLNETIVPADYNPLVVDELEQASKIASSCGDKKVERAEDCDPPNTLCTTDLGDPGICTSSCQCVEPADFGKEPVKETQVAKLDNNSITGKSDNLTNSQSANESKSTKVNESSIPVVDTSNDDSAKEEGDGPGFFSKMWAWIVGIFS